MSRDPALVQVVDARRLEVREVVAVVDDAHEIGLDEADADLEARRLGKRTHGA